MTERYLRGVREPPGVLAGDFQRIRDEFKLPHAFPEPVLAEAERAAAATWLRDGRLDLRDQPFLTIDPPGSMDLDQAMLLERSGAGYVVRYAIADVAAVVPAGGAIEQEAWLRGETVYCPDQRVSLYPPAIGEGAASLLPDQERPAFVYVIELDAEGRQRSARVDRAVVRVLSPALNLEPVESSWLCRFCAAAQLGLVGKEHIWNTSDLGSVRRIGAYPSDFETVWRGRMRGARGWVPTRR